MTRRFWRTGWGDGFGFVIIGEDDEAEDWEIEFTDGERGWAGFELTESGSGTASPAPSRAHIQRDDIVT